MKSTRTIFLATDGRYVIVSSEAGGDLNDVALAQIMLNNICGWIADVSGNLHGKRAPKLTRRDAVGGADDSQWDAAAAAFRAAR